MLRHCHTLAIQCAPTCRFFVIIILFDVILTNRLVIWQFTFFCFVAFDWLESVRDSQHIVHVHALPNQIIKSSKWDWNKFLYIVAFVIDYKNERQLNSILLVTGNNRFLLWGQLSIEHDSSQLNMRFIPTTRQSSLFYQWTCFPIYVFGSRDIKSDRITVPHIFVSHHSNPNHTSDMCV